MFKKSIVLATLLISSGLSFGAGDSLIPTPRVGPFSDPNAASIKRCGLSLDEKNELVEALASKSFAAVQARFETMTFEQLEKSFSEGYKTWLHYAVEGGDLLAVQYFIGRGMNVNATIKSSQKTPLFLAVENNNLAIVQPLIQVQGIDLNIQCRDDQTTALCLASYDGSVAVAGALIDAGADIHIVDDLGNTPIHYAMGRGMVGDETGRIAVALIQKGASLNVKNSAGETPLDLAQRNNNAGVLWAVYDNDHTSIKEPSFPRPSFTSSQEKTSLNIPRAALRAAWIAAALGFGYKMNVAFEQAKKHVIAKNKAAREKDDTVKLITDDLEIKELAGKRLWKKHKKVSGLFFASVLAGIIDVSAWVLGY